jgi:hypothetical protein
MFTVQSYDFRFQKFQSYPFFTRITLVLQDVRAVPRPSVTMLVCVAYRRIAFILGCVTSCSNSRSISCFYRNSSSIRMRVDVEIPFIFKFAFACCHPWCVWGDACGSMVDYIVCGDLCLFRLRVLSLVKDTSLSVLSFFCAFRTQLGGEGIGPPSVVGVSVVSGGDNEWVGCMFAFHPVSWGWWLNFPRPIQESCPLNCLVGCLHTITVPCSSHVPLPIDSLVGHTLHPVSSPVKVAFPMVCVTHCKFCMLSSPLGMGASNAGGIWSAPPCISCMSLRSPSYGRLDSPHVTARAHESILSDVWGGVFVLLRGHSIHLWPCSLQP